MIVVPYCPQDVVCLAGDMYRIKEVLECVTRAFKRKKRVRKCAYDPSHAESAGKTLSTGSKRPIPATLHGRLLFANVPNLN